MPRPELDIQVLPGFMLRRAQQIAVSLFLDETGESGLTPIQFGVLQTLIDAPLSDQATLAARVGIDTATLATLIERLESRGYLARTASASDRRRKSLSITPAGRELVRALRPSVLAAQRRILAPLAAAERKEFLRLLGKLVEGNNTASRAPLRRA